MGRAVNTSLPAARESTACDHPIASRWIAVFFSLALGFVMLAAGSSQADGEDSAFDDPDDSPSKRELAREQAALARIAAWNIDGEADYARILDQESEGVFSKLLAARDPATTIAGYRSVIGAYTDIVETLYTGYSPHADTLPAWYKEQLAKFGLNHLGSVDKKPARFFRKELKSRKMDRVIHAFYILSINRYDLVDESGKPTQLRKEMLGAARKDKQGRYWISLYLAERRLLPDDFEFERYRTENVTEFESLRMHVGLNAKALGPRIYRVIDLPIKLNDQRISHFHISEAKRSTRDRIREHWLLADGREAAYERMTTELQGMRTGSFSSSRFQELLDKDLNYLYDAYGLPPNPRSMLRLLDRIYETKGQQRMMMRVALNTINDKYQLVMRRQKEKKKQAIARKPLIDIDSIVKMGPDKSYAFLEKALTNEKNLRLINHLIENEAVPAVAARYKPKTPRDIERALLRGYQLIGHPTALRAKYFDAMAQLASLDPQRQIKQPPPRDAFVNLIDLFNQVTSAREFGHAFTALQTAEMSFIVRRDANPNPELVASFIRGAVVAIRHQANIRSAAREEVTTSRDNRERVSQQIKDAEADIQAANLRIRQANLEAKQAEARARAAIEERNQIVEKINQKILNVKQVQHENEVDRATRRPDGMSINKRETEVLNQRELAAREELSDTERRLLPVIAQKEEQSARAEAEADAAQERASRGLLEAQSAERRARASIVHENAAFEVETRAMGREEASLERILDILKKVVVGFDFMGIAPNPALVGQLEVDLNQRLAGLAMLSESAFKGELTTEMTLLLQAEAQSEQESSQLFAQLAIEFGS